MHQAHFYFQYGKGSHYSNADVFLFTELTDRFLMQYIINVMAESF